MLAHDLTFADRFWGRASDALAETSPALAWILIIFGVLIVITVATALLIEWLD